MVDNAQEPRMPPYPITPFDGKSPQYDETAFIDPSARLMGDVHVGPGVSIWPFVLLRADSNRITVGERSALLDHVLVESPRDHAVLIERSVVISHGAILHGCVVREGAIVGIGAMVLDGAEVGRGAIVGSGSVVPPGMKVPERSLVLGIPGKVVRSLSDEEVERSKEQLQESYEKSRRYLEIMGGGRASGSKG